MRQINRPGWGRSGWSNPVGESLDACRSNRPDLFTSGRPWGIGQHYYLRAGWSRPIPRPNRDACAHLFSLPGFALPRLVLPHSLASLLANPTVSRCRIESRRDVLASRLFASTGGSGSECPPHKRARAWTSPMVRDLLTSNRVRYRSVRHSIRTEPVRKPKGLSVRNTYYRLGRPVLCSDLSLPSFTLFDPDRLGSIQRKEGGLACDIRRSGKLKELRPNSSYMNVAVPYT